jgi:fatty-acyl-CoA synthase
LGETDRPDGRAGTSVFVALRSCGSRPASDCSQAVAKYAKWQVPDRFEFIDEIPRTATGKFKKTALREMFVDAEVSTSAGESR